MAHGKWKRLGTGELLTEDADEGLGHIVPISVYNTVFVTLIILTIATVWAATLDVSETSHLIIALFIATIKAIAVVAIFMHLRFEKKILVAVAIYPFFILALMIVGTTGDAVVKKEIVPSAIEVNYVKGKAFGVDDRFLKPDPNAKEAAHGHDSHSEANH